MRRFNKKVPALFLIAGVWLLFQSCMDSVDLPVVPSGVQAFSLLGDTLYTPEPDPDAMEEYEENLQKALEDYTSNPEDADAIIWLGRRTAYLGQYREAVRIFNEGVFKHPEDPRMYRHRGHRYLTLRMFDQAVSDFEAAAERMADIPDEIEPDGLLNELNRPTSTLKSNVWYHLGLANYLKGDFEEAISAHENALKLDLTEDMRIATLYWYYMALKRSGQDEKAGEVIEGVTPETEVIENEAYLNLILVFNGIFDPGRLLEISEDALQDATLGYGIGHWHYLNGRQNRAEEIWRRVYETGYWPAFGYIAAESELANPE